MSDAERKRPPVNPSLLRLPEGVSDTGDPVEGNPAAAMLIAEVIDDAWVISTADAIADKQ